MENRRLHHAGDVGGVGGGARIFRQRGEADLVVDDEVQRAAGAIAIELRKVQRFGNDALAGESGVAVDQQRNDATALGIAEALLLGAHHAFDDRD